MPRRAPSVCHVDCRYLNDSWWPLNPSRSIISIYHFSPSPSTSIHISVQDTIHFRRLTLNQEPPGTTETIGFCFASPSRHRIKSAIAPPGRSTSITAWRKVKRGIPAAEASGVKHRHGGIHGYPKIVFFLNKVRSHLELDDDWGYP